MRTAETMGGRAKLVAAQSERIVWADQELDVLRDGLKRGATLVDIATALGRSPEAIAVKIEELAAPKDETAQTEGE
jgi:hypothetical protein